jgi:hypothetical protein
VGEDFDPPGGDGSDVEANRRAGAERSVLDQPGGGETSEPSALGEGDGVGR